MATNILKAILAGFLTGVLIFFMPFFLLRFLFIALIIGLIFRLVGFRRRWHGASGPYSFWRNPDYRQRWHNMSREEKKAFREKMEQELFAGTTENTQQSL